MTRRRQAVSSSKAREVPTASAAPGGWPLRLVLIGLAGMVIGLLDPLEGSPLVALASGLYVTVAAPLLAESTARGGMTLRAIGVLLGLWVGTALVYPWLRRSAIWFVDTVVLRRADYDLLRSEIVAMSGASEDPEKILDDIEGGMTGPMTAVTAVSAAA